jgi:hypothetical protein
MRIRMGGWRLMDPAGEEDDNGDGDDGGGLL